MVTSSERCSFFSSTLSWVSRDGYFQRPFLRDSRVWRLVFTIGLVLGAVLFTVLPNEGQTFTTQVQEWRLAIGGFLTPGERLDLAKALRQALERARGAPGLA